jgi:PAS domain S-box-containing protein
MEVGMDHEKCVKSLEEASSAIHFLEEKYDQLSDIERKQLVGLGNEIQALFSRREDSNQIQPLPPEAPNLSVESLENIIRENQHQKALLDAIFMADPSGLAVLTGQELRFVYVNPVYRYITPDPMQDPVGRLYEEIWPAGAGDIYLDQIRCVIQTGKPFQTLDFKCRFPGGSPQAFTFQARRIEWDTHPAVLIILWDTTELTRTRDHLAHLSSELEAVFDSMNEGMIIHYAHPNGSVHANQSAIRMLGFDPEKVDLTKINEMIRVEAIDGQSIPFDQVPNLFTIATQRVENLRLRMTGHDRQTRTLLISINPFFDVENVQLGVVTLWRDISELEKNEIALRASEARYRRLVDFLPDGILVECGGRFTFLNPAAQRLFGAENPEQMVGKPVVDFAAPEYQDLIAERLRHLNVDRIEVPEIEETYLRVDGTRIDVSSVAAPIIHDGQPGAIAVMRDITQRKKAENALRESEKRERTRAAQLEAIMESAPALIWISHDPQSHLITGNAYAYEFLKREPGENISQFSSDGNASRLYRFMKGGQEIPDEELPLQLAAAQGIEVRNSEYEVMFEDGEVRYILGNAVPMVDADGKPTGSVSAFLDFTAHRHAEQALKMIQERLVDILESTHDYFFALDQDWRFVYINRRFADVLGQKSENILGKVFWGTLSKYLHSPVEKYFRQAMDQRLPVQFEMEGYYTDKWYNVSIYPNRDGLSVFLSDRTEEKLAERALRESEERYSKLFTTRHTPILLIDPDNGEIVDANPAASDFYGYTRDELLQKTIYEINSLPHEDVTRIIQTILAAPTTLQFFFKHRLAGGEFRDVEVHSGPIRVGRKVYLYSIITDQTELHRLQHELLELESSRRVQHRLIDQRERERLQIARDLHDGPLQELIATTYSLQAAIEGLGDAAPAKEFQAVQSELHRQVRALRAFAYELRPPILANMGLENAIRSNVQTFIEKNPHLKVHVDIHGPRKAMSESVRLALFRIYQEAMNNITRHSHASRVDVEVQAGDQRLVMKIRDDGVGFDLPADWLDLARDGHLGLVGILERAEAVNGRVNVITRPGEGTELIVEIPLEDPSAE